MASVSARLSRGRISPDMEDFFYTAALIFLDDCIEAGALLVLIQIFVVVFLTLDHPAILLIEGIAAQLYVSCFLPRLDLPESPSRWSRGPNSLVPHRA